MVRFDPVTVAVDREAPVIGAELVGRRLSWRARDRATPWLRLSLRLDRPTRRRWIRLGTRELEGSHRLPRVGARWEATLVAADSSGNRARVGLGAFGGR